MSTSEIKPDPSVIHRWFIKAGMVSVAALIGVLIAGLIGLNGLIAPLIPQTAKIHAASSQAISAQNISILATQLAAAKRPGALYTFRTQLASELAEFEAVHRGLMYGDAALGLSASMSADVRELLLEPENGLDRHVRDFIDQVRRDFLSDALTVEDDLAQGLSDFTQLELSPRLKKLTDLLANEVRSSVHQIQSVKVALVAFLSLTMLLLGRFIVRPLALKVAKLIIGDPKKEEKNALRFDEVTGLANRAHLTAFMLQHCKVVQAHDLTTAVLDLEIQGLGEVRSKLDIPDADELMSMIARRIESVCRSGDFIARVAGDEFVVVLASIEDDMTLNDVTNALRTKLALPFAVNEGSHSFRTKIGIKIATGKDKVPTAILNQAATALKISKASDNYDIQFFENNMEPKAKQREKDLNELKAGLKNSEFIVHFQPITDIKSDATIGLEAFARWQHPKKGLLTPIHFLELIKNSGLSNDLTRTVLGDVLKALRTWEAQSVSVPFVSINLDETQLGDASLVDELKWILDSYSCPPSRIGLELPERALLPDAGDTIRQNVKKLSDQGFKLILDGYGTSGLRINSVRDLKIEQIKLDRAFVANIDSDLQQQKITKELAGQVKSSKAKLTASGVETPAERTVLERIQVDAVQGYLICPPMDVDDLSDWFSVSAKPDHQKSA